MGRLASLTSNPLVAVPNLEYS